MPRRRAFPTSSASSATTMSGAPSSSPRQQIRQLGVRLKHSANRAVVNGKRIVLIDDSIVRGTTSVKIVQMMRDAGATRGAFPHRLPADHPFRLLRHRHAGARQAAGRHPRSRRHAQLHRRRLARVPVGRGHLSRHGLRAARSGCDRSSPTIASPAIIRPRSPTRPGRKRRRGNCRCSPKRVDARHFSVVAVVPTIHVTFDCDRSARAHARHAS